jgi:4-hydroxy-2-oxoheptanedioate aldolase
MGPESVQAVVAGAALGCVPAVVRVPDGSGTYIAAALDAGAAGVLVPRVGTAAAAEAAVRAARYPPLGERGVGPGRASGYGRRIADALAGANDTTLVAVQVETRAAVEALDEILAVEGIDVVFVGPGDLAASLGLEGGLGSPELASMIANVVTRTAAAGVLTGAFAPDIELARAWQRLDVRFLLVGSDLVFLAAAVEQAWAELRSPAR